MTYLTQQSSPLTWPGKLFAAGRGCCSRGASKLAALDHRGWMAGSFSAAGPACPRDDTQTIRVRSKATRTTAERLLARLPMPQRQSDMSRLLRGAMSQNHRKERGSRLQVVEEPYGASHESKLPKDVIAGLSRVTEPSAYFGHLHITIILSTRAVVLRIREDEQLGWIENELASWQHGTASRPS